MSRKIQDGELICPVCNTALTLGDRHFMVAIEVPYMNIFFHKECYKTINFEFIVDYVQKITQNKNL